MVEGTIVAQSFARSSAREKARRTRTSSSGAFFVLKLQKTTPAIGPGTT